jgi:hypothetical protein
MLKKVCTDTVAISLFNTVTSVFYPSIFNELLSPVSTIIYIDLPKGTRIAGWLPICATQKFACKAS